MNESIKQYARRFDALKSRERGLVAATLLVVIGLLWWNYHADPMMRKIETLQSENRRIGTDTEATSVALRDIRRRIADGVHREKENQLVLLGEQLDKLEEQLRIKTIELIDPEKMFLLMNQLIYRDSQLKLLSLGRREVKPAIPPLDPDKPDETPGIYRHVLEIEFTGNYLDILDYMQSMEALDWKLLWDEIEISAGEHPKVTVKLVMSTLSIHKQWVGI